MRRPARCLVLAALLVAVSQLAAAPAQRLRVHVALNLRVNAVYHAACLADSIPCTREVFDQFWKSHLTWSEADQSALDAWRRVMTAVTAAAPARPAAPLLPNTPRFHPAQAARTTVIVAALEATSAADLRVKAQGIISEEDAAQLSRTVERFEQRLSAWFKTAAGPEVQRRIKLVDQSVRELRFTNTVEKVAAFLEAELPAPVLYVDAIVGPAPRSEDFAATQLGSHLLAEVVDAASVSGIVSGAMHELTHYLYDCAAAEKHRSLITQFVQSGSPQAAGLYTYLNEAIAVGAQALLEPDAASSPVRVQTLKKKDDEYRHPYVAPLGAAAIPLVRDAVERKRTLVDGFAVRYMAAGIAALKEKASEPQFLLAQVGLLLPADGNAIRAAWLQAMFPQASATFKDEREADAFPDLNIVRFVRYSALAIDGVRAVELPALLTHRAFVYALPRGQRATTYIVAGRGDEEIVGAIRKLAALTALPSKGIVLTVD